MDPILSIEHVPSRYQFVHVISRRARKIQNGARPMLNSTSRKPTKIAQDEAFAGLLDYIIPVLPNNETGFATTLEQKPAPKG